MQAADPDHGQSHDADDLARFFQDAAGRGSVGAALPDGSVVRFEIRGEGGGTWTLVRVGARVDLMEPPIHAPDCNLACSAADFRALLTGALEPREGYLSGRLELTGDVGIVLGLRRALRKPRRAAGA